MNRKQVDAFEVLNARLQPLYTEMQTLVKKSPNDGVNQFKLRLINAVLQDANDWLTDASKPVAGFDKFDESTLPSNSDVLIVLSQYLGFLEKIRTDNIEQDEDTLQWYWVVNSKLSNVRTIPPKKLGKP